MAAGDTGNLDIQLQINEAIAARSAMLVKQAEIMKGQAMIASEICKALKCEGLDDLENRLNGIVDAMKDASGQTKILSSNMEEAAKKAKKELNNIQNVMKQAEKKRKIWLDFFKKDLLDAIKKLFKTITDSVSRVFTQIGSLIGILKSVTRGFVGIGLSILSIPFAILDKLQQKAAELAQAGLAIRAAWQELVDTFGSLSRGAGSEASKFFANMNKESGNLAGSGRTLSSIFGYGPEGIAEAIKGSGEIIEGFGPTIYALGDQISEAAAEVVILSKGLGLTKEQLLAVGRSSLATGKKTVTILKEMGNQATQLARRYNLDSKSIGKDLGFIAENSGKFGKSLREQLSSSIVYANKLGLSIKDLMGLTDAFGDFEGAAMNVSKLAGAFNVNIDSLEMFKEQDPAKQLDMLRKSFMAAGYSAENMNRAQKSLIATSTNLDINLIEAAFSAENMGKSYEEITAAAEEAADAQLTESEILQDIGTNIKELFAPIQYAAGLFENFFNGFLRGWMGMYGSASPLIRQISKALISFERAGFLVGRVFGGLEQSIPIIRAITNVYGELASSTGDLTVAFTEFFSLMETDPTLAIKTLASKLKSIFSRVFSPNSELMISVKEAFVSSFMTIFEMTGSLLEWLIPQLKSSLSEFLDYLTKVIPDSISRIGTGAKSESSSMLTRLADSFIDLVSVIGEKLQILFQKSFEAAWNNPKLRTYIQYAIAGLFIYIFGPSLLTLVVGTITTFAGLLLSFLGTVISSMLVSVAGAPAVATALGSVATALMSAGGAGAAAAVAAPEAAAGAVAAKTISGSINSLLNAVNSIKKTDVIKASFNLTLIAGTLLAAAGLLALEMAGIGYIVAKYGGIKNLAAGLFAVISALGVVGIMLVEGMVLGQLKSTAGQALVGFGVAVVALAAAGALAEMLRWFGSTIGMAGAKNIGYSILAMGAVTLAMGEVVLLIGALALLGTAFTGAQGAIIALTAAAGMVVFKVAIDQIQTHMLPALKQIADFDIDVQKLSSKVSALGDVFSMLDPIVRMMEIISSSLEDSSVWGRLVGKERNVEDFKRATDVMNVFVDSVMEKLVQTTKRMIENISGITIDGNEIKKAEVFSKILAPAINLFSSISEAISKVKPVEVGSGYARKIVGIQEQIEDFTRGFFGSGRGGLISVIATAFKYLREEVENNLKDMKPAELKTLAEKIGVFSKAAEMLPQISEAFLKMSEVAKNIGTTMTTSKESSLGILGALSFGLLNASDKSEKVVTESGNATQFIDSIITAFFGDGSSKKGMMGELISIFNRTDIKNALSDSESIKKRSELLPIAINAVTSAMKSIGEALSNTQFSGSSWNEKLEEAGKMGETYSAFVNALGDIIQKMVNKFKEASSGLSDVAFMGVQVQSDILSTIATSFIENDTILRKFDISSPLDPEAYQKYFNSLYTATTWYLDASRNLHKWIGGDPKRAFDWSNSVNKIVESMNATSNSMTQIPSAMAILEDLSDKNYQEVAKGVLEDVKATNEALSQIGDIKLKATLEKIGKNLFASDVKKLITERKIEINVNFEVSMDTDTVATSVFEAAKEMSLKGMPPA